MDKEPDDKKIVDDKVDIGDVRKNWRVVEDFGMAYSMQQNEFSQHYDLNRFERRTMHGDTKLSKDEQRIEDKYAAEYYEQLRRDMEKEDERIAMELQRQMELEERSQVEQDLSRDEEIARRMQEMEQSQAGASKRPSTVSNLVKKSSSGNRLVLPPGLTPETVAAIEEAQRDGTPLRLPAGITPDQLRAIRHALKDDDQRLAQEIQDYELALYLQNKEKALADAEKQRRLSQEQVQNLQNQTYVAATKGTLIDVAGGGGRRHNHHHSSSSNSSSQQNGHVKIAKANNDEPDLINFDDDNGGAADDNFPLPPPTSEQLRTPPERPPPPLFASPNGKMRVALPAQSQQQQQPSVSLAGSGGGVVGRQEFSPGNPFANNGNVTSSSIRDPTAMGGVRVLPNK